MDISLQEKRRGSEKIWLDAAYQLLTEQGVEAVKVMPLAKLLNVTRTSFYWHFKDRESLLEAIVDIWERKNTGNLIIQAEKYAETISEAMFNLSDCWLDDDLFDTKLDLAIRNWARNDPTLQARLDQADKQRRDAVNNMFLRFGYSADQAKVRALSVLYTQVGYISMQIEETPAGRVDRMPDYMAIYTGQQPTQSEIRRFRARHGQ